MPLIVHVSTILNNYLAYPNLGVDSKILSYCVPLPLTVRTTHLVDLEDNKCNIDGFMIPSLKIGELYDHKTHTLNIIFKNFLKKRNNINKCYSYPKYTYFP